MDQAKEMAKIAFEALEDKKGEDVCAIDISAVSVLADYFVIANGNRLRCKRDRRTQKRSMGID